MIKRFGLVLIKFLPKYTRSKLLILIFLLMVFTALEAQDDPVTLTLAVPSYVEGGVLADDSIFEDFYNRFPNTSIKVVAIGDLPGDESGIYDPLAHGEAYVNRADVLFVDSELGLVPMINVQQTVANFYLDLQPMEATDSEYDIENFHPSVADVFRWGNGLWALPIAFDVELIAYDPARFDEAGVSYPHRGWSLDDLAQAARALTEYDGEGNIITPGFTSVSTSAILLIMSLMDKGIVDTSLPIPQIQVDRQQVSELLTTWSESDVLTYASIGDNAFTTFDPAMRLGNIGLILNPAYSYHAASLPGGGNPLNAVGVAVSKGTAHPDLAYQLASYLTHQPELATAVLRPIPARLSYGSEHPININPLRRLSQEEQGIINTLIENALLPRDRQFGSRLSGVMYDLVLGPRTPLDESLDQLEEGIQSILARAQELSETVTIDIPVPVPVEGLQFGVVSPTITNQFEWERLAQEFVMMNPGVESISIDSSYQHLNVKGLANRFDCFYAEGLAFSVDDLPALYSMSPLLAADTELEADGFLGNLLSYDTIEAQHWGLPLSIDPMVMAVNEDILNIQIPDDGWTITEFESLLPVLADLTPGVAPVQVHEYRDSLLLSLISAHSGPPADYLVTPHTLYFDNPEMVQSIQDVLDLIRNGYMEYVPPYMSSNEPTIAIGTYSFLSMHDDYHDYRLVPLPHGEHPLVLTARLGGVYISKQTTYMTECYDFIRFLILNSERLNLVSGYGHDPEALNNEFHKQLNTFWDEYDVVFLAPVDATPSNSPTQQSILYMLVSIFDTYIEQGQDYDLGSNLKEVKVTLDAFQECIYSIDIHAAQSQIIEDYIGCVDIIDPQMGDSLRDVSG